MAAAPSKPSPSNRPIDGSDATSTNDAAATATACDSSIAAGAKHDAGAVASPPAVPAETASSLSPPTYQSVESSEVFRLAQRHLKEGKFEEAIAVIEEGIRDTKDLLKKSTTNNSNSTSPTENDDYTLHESLAPFHYLYGTTLLYEIEETDQQVTTAGSAVSAAVVSGEQAAAAQQDDDTPESDSDAFESEAADAVEDLEVAWENFEIARASMEKLMDSNPNKELTEMLELDLAQVYLREGDLQRMNGRYENAVKDYQSCLRLRKKSKLLETYDRKIADVHYNLGMLYMNVASKDEQTTSDDESPNSAVAVAKVKNPDEDEKIKDVKRLLARNKGVYHFLECSKCFCGQIASMCNADPKSVMDISNEDNAERKTGPNFKTTGEEHDEMELPEAASSKLRAMRTRITALVSSTSFTADQKATVDELSEFLEDIQETLDEAENGRKGVQEVTNMHAEVAALAAADGEIGESKPGETTTIGFGSAASSLGATVEAASAAPASIMGTPSSPARPMMVIKKKKRIAVQPIEQTGVKQAKAEAE